jgi:hypothetical protein
VKPKVTPRLRAYPVLAACAVAAAALLATVPTGLGFSGGITKDNAGVPEFEAVGCLACHGNNQQWTPADTSVVGWQVRDQDGAFLNGPYDPEATYTINITLREQVAPEAENHAGFNLRVTGGELAGVEGVSQVSTDGTQATHVGPGRTSWSVTWTPPPSGAVAFQLFVNDVDGDGDPSRNDVPLLVFFGFTDPDHAVLGAAAEPEEPHFGITLQQYWIGLIGLAGMILIMVAGYVYLKFGSAHNTDKKDR